MAEEDEEDDKGTFANRRDEITKKTKKVKQSNGMSKRVKMCGGSECGGCECAQ